MGKSNTTAGTCLVQSRNSMTYLGNVAVDKFLGASPDFKSMFIRSIRTFLKGWPWASALKHCSSRAPIPE